MSHSAIMSNRMDWRDLKQQVLHHVSLSKSQLLFDFLSLSDLFEYQAVKYSDELYHTLLGMLNKLDNDYPFEYIVGECYFGGLQLNVTKDTLIPRFDSECLLEYATNHILAHWPENSSNEVLDLGTGSGALTIALAIKFPQLKFTAVDISDKALLVAISNAKRYGCTNIEFLQSDWAGALDGCYALAISNPPYLSEDEWQSSPPLHFEPKSALVPTDLRKSVTSTGANQPPDVGLDSYYALLSSLDNKLISNGKIILEHGDQQSALVCDILREFGYKSMQTHTDLSQRDRMTVATKANRVNGTK